MFKLKSLKLNLQLNNGWNLHRKTSPIFLRGFTLIELLIVLAIVATLLTMVAPKYFNQLETSKESVLKENLQTMRRVIDQFYSDKGRYPENLTELVDTQYLRSIPKDPITESTSTWLITGVPAGQKGSVYDIKSGATGQSKNGQNFSDW
jgi:general secretion pathway protein G